MIADADPAADVRVCVICRRAVAPDDDAIRIHGVSVHVGCAAYRRRSTRR
jgi:hypothetical protein